MLACELIDIKIDDEQGTETRSQKQKRQIAEGTYFIHCQQVKIDKKKGDRLRLIQGRCLYCQKHATLTCSRHNPKLKVKNQLGYVKI